MILYKDNKKFKKLIESIVSKEIENDLVVECRGLKGNYVSITIRGHLCNCAKEIEKIEKLFGLTKNQLVEERLFSIKYKITKEQLEMIYVTLKLKYGQVI